MCNVIKSSHTNMIGSDEVQLFGKLSYKWDVDDNTLKLFKTTQSRFYSPSFGKWKLSFMTYKSDGYASLRLELDLLPTLIRSIVAKVRFGCKGQNKESQVYRAYIFG